MDIKLSLFPSHPRVATTAVVSIATYAPEANGKEVPIQVHSYPFRVLARGPTGVTPVFVHPTHGGFVWKGNVRFDRPGQWQVSVLNFSGANSAAGGDALHFMVRVGPGSPTRAAIIQILDFALGLIFLAAAVPKIVRPRLFRLGVKSYGLVPSAFSWPIAVLLIVAEVGVVLLLFGGFYLPSGAVGATLLLVIFAVAQGINLLHGRSGPCHCFGSTQSEGISVLSLGRTVCLLGAACAALALELGTSVELASPSRVLSALTIAGGLAGPVLLADAYPKAWKALRARAVLAPSTTRVVSFKHKAREQSLFFGLDAGDRRGIYD